MPERVLLVDDDPNLLSALQRQLRKQFVLTTAEGGAPALQAVAEANERREPFAVVLCDMRMPGMDGIEVLSRIRGLSPDTVRMMLTGNADQQTAIDAINKGNIFRFFTKPCPAEELAIGLQSGIDQYHLITAERELLENTLAGSVKVLADVVSMNDPVAYGLATRLREWVRLLTIEFKLPQRWQLDMAAMLIPIGQVSIPPEVIAKKRRGEALSEAEQSIVDRAPEAGRNLIANIPRLGKVAETIWLQDRGYDGTGFPADGPKGADIPFDARLLKILKDLAEACPSGIPDPTAFAQLDRNRAQYDPNLLVKVRHCLMSLMAGAAPVEAEVPVSILRPGHLVLSDIRLTNGHLILAARTILSAAQVERLRSLGKIYTFVEPVRVRVG
ncbi:MAG TPA: HD domain-containing phosphohydrolase [Magnetospirillum sp.]|nr:HD domain-containing phosphohydrolase [Magnetospirillum sp.]